MSMERIIKYASIAELIGIALYFLCMAGGFFLKTGSPLYLICAYTAGFLWYTLGMVFCLIIFLLMVSLWRYLLSMTSGPSRELSVKKAEKMPWFWTILAIAAFLAYMSFTAALMQAG